MQENKETQNNEAISMEEYLTKRRKIKEEEKKKSRKDFTPLIPLLSLWEALTVADTLGYKHTIIQGL